MYFRVNLKMEKPMLLFYMDSTYWTKFQSCISVIKETWDYRFASKVGGMGTLKK